MEEPGSLAPVFEGAYGVFSVQNPMISGFEGEIRQGKNVAEAARQAGVRHLVYASTGTGEKGTGIPSWESKLVIEDHMKALGLPLTVLRPKAFLELMTGKQFFPPVAVWHVMPKLMGSSTRIGWIGADDLGFIAAMAFAEPDRFIGEELHLASDVRSIDELRGLYREVMGRNPPRFPMPAWLFARFGDAGKDLPVMWRWLRDGTIDWDTETTRAIHPAALDARAWLQKQKTHNAG
jgi:uncharacterized protein YbjT (DUF2867 family)